MIKHFVKTIFNRATCKAIGHKSSIASCPFTGNTYDSCSRCSSYKIVPKKVSEPSEHI